MRREDAIKKLGKLLGKSLGYRVDPKAPDADEREQAMAELAIARPIRDEVRKAMDDRKAELLRGDPEFQRLCTEYAEARKHCEKLQGITGHYRFAAGTSNGIFFMIAAQGDSWEEVIAKIEKDKKLSTVG